MLALLERVISKLSSRDFWIGVMVPVVVGLIGLTPWLLEEDKTDIHIERILATEHKNYEVSGDRWTAKEVNEEEYGGCFERVKREKSIIDEIENTTGLAVVRFDLRNNGTRSATIKDVRLRHRYMQNESARVERIQSMSTDSPIFFGPDRQNTGEFAPYINLAPNGIVSLDIPIRPSIDIFLNYESICFDAQVNYYDGTQDSFISKKIKLTPYVGSFFLSDY